MSNPNTVTLYHGPPSRSSSVLTLLEELGAPYELQLLSFKRDDQRKSDFLAINPLGKVPAIRHQGVIVTEQVAIFIYLADAFPAAGLAPKIGDPLRGPYLRWLAIYGSAWEPAMVDRANKRDVGMRAMSPYGDFDALFGMLTAQLSKGPYLLDNTFSAADMLWGGALGWMTQFKMLPDDPVISAYVARHNARPAVLRSRVKDQELVKTLG